MLHPNTGIEFGKEVDELRAEIASKDARIKELEEEQRAWRKFTDEANSTVDKAESRIAKLEKVVEELTPLIDWIPYDNSRRIRAALAALKEGPC